MYIRDPRCFCHIYQDIDTLPFKDRPTEEVYWREGIIYTPQGSVECECHKKYRLSKRYDVIANQLGLATYGQLKSMKYVGDGNAYNKLKEVPVILENNPHVKDVVLFCTGAEGNQKTTSVTKLMYNLISEGKTVEYTTFSDLIQKFLDSNYKPIQYIVADWLIIDDCFLPGGVNYKSTYNSFYNLVLKRHNPTILVSNKNKDAVMHDRMSPYYNEEQLQQLFKRVDKFKTTIEFTDNIDKLQLLKDGPIDLWNIGNTNAISE